MANLIPYLACQERRSRQTAPGRDRDILDDVLAIEKADVLRTGEILQNLLTLSARDSVHNGADSVVNPLQFRPTVKVCIETQA